MPSGGSPSGPSAPRAWPSARAPAAAPARVLRT